MRFQEIIDLVKCTTDCEHNRSRNELTDETPDEDDGNIEWKAVR